MLIATIPGNAADLANADAKQRNKPRRNHVHIQPFVYFRLIIAAYLQIYIKKNHGLACRFRHPSLKNFPPKCAALQPKSISPLSPPFPKEGQGWFA